MRKKKIAIALTFDDAYCKYASVTISSIMENTPSDVFCDIIIISEGLNDDHIRLLSSQISLKKNFNLIFRNISNIDNSKLFLNSYMSNSTYYRFYIADLLPDYDKVLYLDSDLVVNTDLSCLFEVDMCRDVFLAVEDSVIQPIIEKIMGGG